MQRGYPVAVTALPPSQVQPAGSRRGIVGLVVRGGSWQATAQLVPLLVNIVLTPIVIPGLGVDRYGLFLLVSVIGSILVVADGGIGGAAIRYLAIYAGSNDKASATRLVATMAVVVAGAGTVVFGTIFVLAREVVQAFRVPPYLIDEGAYLLRALVVIAGVAVVRGLFAAVLNAHQRFALTSINTNVGHAVYAAGVLLTVHYGWGLYGIAWTFGAQQVAATALIVPSALRLLDRQAVGLMPKGERRPFFRYALTVQWSNSMTLATMASDSLVVGAFLPVRQVAYYQTGANFALQIRNVPFNALAPIETILGRDVGARGAEGARGQFEWLQRLWVIGTAGWSAVAMGAAWFGVTAWLGPDFRISGVVAVIVLLGYAFSLWSAVMNAWTQLLGKPEIGARGATVAVVVNLALTVALVVPLGIIGTVAATAVSQIVLALYLLRLARKKLPGVAERSFLRDVPIVACVVAVASVVGLEILARPVVPSGALGLLVSGLVAAPGLLVFTVAVLGPRASVQLARGRVSVAMRTLDRDS